MPDRAFCTTKLFIHCSPALYQLQIYRYYLSRAAKSVEPFFGAPGKEFIFGGRKFQGNANGYVINQHQQQYPFHIAVVNRVRISGKYKW